ncbi:hypothetical protein F3J34_35405 [Klebsiella sp. Ap-873]|nr:hypothetical protein [Klebsiella sp. Ap-873]
MSEPIIRIFIHGARHHYGVRVVEVSDGIRAITTVIPAICGYGILRTSTPVLAS